MSVSSDRYDQGEDWPEAQECPKCGHPIENDGTAYYCSNYLECDWAVTDPSFTEHSDKEWDKS